MSVAEDTYFQMIKYGCTPQEARSVLPNSIKTEVVMTANYREWRHFFWLRAARKTGPAHPQMEELTVPLLYEVSVRCTNTDFDPVIEKYGLIEIDRRRGNRYFVLSNEETSCE